MKTLPLRILLVSVFSLLSLQAFAARSTCKTIRVEHVLPIIIVSEKSVLMLQFASQSRADATGPLAAKDIRHTCATYRYQVFDGTSGATSSGEGMVEEAYQSISTNANGVNVNDVGCHTKITAGEFDLSWSEATAGSRSWLYYCSDSPIRFIQQPQYSSFESIASDQFRRFLASRNVQEFVHAGRLVQVVGPAVFEAEMPTEKPVSAYIESGRIRDGAFELKLANLATNKSYVIESSYQIGPGNWTVIHSFIARQADQSWSDPLSKDVNTAFYRIREDVH